MIDWIDDWLVLMILFGPEPVFNYFSLARPGAIFFVNFQIFLLAGHIWKDPGFYFSEETYFLIF
jgi:hypothetical protein